MLRRLVRLGCHFDSQRISHFCRNTQTMYILMYSSKHRRTFAVEQILSQWGSLVFCMFRIYVKIIHKYSNNLVLIPISGGISVVKMSFNSLIPISFDGF